MKKLTVLIISFFALTNSGFSQNQKWKITGKVKNQAGDPLYLASVYVSNSTSGASTDTSGSFSIPGLLNGNYNLIVSFVGYQTEIFPISVNDKNDSVLFVLKESPKELQDVVVNLKNGDRKEQLKLFRMAFIGTDKNARQTDILNEDILKMHTTKEGKLTAHTNDMLSISNKALGYNIKYLLKEFSYDKKTGELHYMGYPLFEEMKPSSKSQQKQWDENRAKVYVTSLLRFYRTMGERKLIQKGYILGDVMKPEVEQVHTGGGVNKKVIVPPNGFLMTLGSEQYVDTLLWPEIPYYRMMTALPGHKYKLNFSGMLSVDATNAVNGLKSTDYYKPGPKTSIITLQQPVEINANGIPNDPSKVLISGYWIGSRIADLLPFDYHPKDEK
ncbi:MAG: carboxypeptidase-like regulatory domain-containing protein [Ginsengibacter sp.]